MTVSMYVMFDYGDGGDCMRREAHEFFFFFLDLHENVLDIYLSIEAKVLVFI